MLAKYYTRPATFGNLTARNTRVDVSARSALESPGFELEGPWEVGEGAVPLPAHASSDEADYTC